MNLAKLGSGARSTNFSLGGGCRACVDRQGYLDQLSQDSPRIPAMRGSGAERKKGEKSELSIDFS